jgi:CO/xanthine dehydrogenase Mo-binding subunit
MSLTGSLIANPRMDRWITFLDDKTARVASGKVEIGQGVVTALHQIAAEELNLPLDRVTLVSGDTDIGPDEMYTTSSLSISMSGGSIRLVAAEAVALLTERAALRLNCAPDDLSVQDGAFLQDGAETGLDYWSVASEIDWSRAVTAKAATKSVSDYTIVGQSTPRLDLPAKVSGAAFVHDMAVDGFVHARILRQPGADAVLVSLGEAAIKRAAKGDVSVYREQNFVAVLSVDEAAAERAAAAAPPYVEWENALDIPVGADEAAWLPGQPAIERELGVTDAPEPAGERVSLTVSRPYVAHASLGPSCALARMDADGKLSIWSHGQGMHNLRKNIGAALKIDIDRIWAKHLHGPGCYGHNGADDAALDAAILARAHPGKTIRVQWRREEEFGYEPLGPAMLVKAEAVVDAAGLPVQWTADIWSPVHVQRPGNPAVVMLGSQALAPPVDPGEERGGGGTRNGFPLYKTGPQRVRHHLTERAPIRTSALRGLGALPNVVAIEGLMDDLAARAGADPVQYRLDLLEDPRARAVLERTAVLAGWQDRGAGGEGQGLGIAFARYKNTAAYCAVAVALTVEEEVRLDHIWTVGDAGLVINPSGACNQLEGGCVQGASWALKEQARFEGQGITTLDWESYPILRFSEVPEITAELMDLPEEPTLGVGECSVGPTAAAIANAIKHALGARIHDMPFTRDRVMAALLR